MKYQSSNTKAIFELNFDGKKRYTCPECSESRSKAKQKDLQYYPENNRSFCFHCNTTFFEYKPFEKKEYILPEWKNKTALTNRSVKWFESRGIKQDTLVKMKIYSDNEWMPQFQKEIEVICFPFFVNGKLINIKYRGQNKSFKVNSGSQLVWYNYDAILENDEIIIVEGEIDCLSFIQVGFNNCISVPNGAKNTEFIDDSIHLFDKKKVLIAVDNDTNGIDLRDELIRRFGAENCKNISFKECKDANEYLTKYGGYELQEAVKNAIDIPIDGNIQVSSFRSDIEDMFVNGIPKGKTISEIEIDQYCTWETKRLAVVTGRPGCFTSDTLVHTSIGVLPISEIKKGDFVLSYNHERKINEYKIVTNTPIHLTHTEKLYKIKLKDGTEIKVTGNHKFYTGSGYLQIKDILLSLRK